jgi:hypothetical protein
MTKTPNHGIDYILTFGIPKTSISTLEADNPAVSDHLGILLDIDLTLLFSSTYNVLGSMLKWKLTTENIRAKTEYEKYITNKLNEYDLWNHVHELHWKAMNR